MFKVTCSNVSGNKQLVNLKTNLSMNEFRSQQNTVLHSWGRRAFVTLQSYQIQIQKQIKNKPLNQNPIEKQPSQTKRNPVPPSCTL